MCFKGLINHQRMRFLFLSSGPIAKSSSLCKNNGIHHHMHADV